MPNGIRILLIQWERKAIEVGGLHATARGRRGLQRPSIWPLAVSDRPRFPTGRAHAACSRLGRVKILLDCGWDARFDERQLNHLTETVQSRDTRPDLVLLSYGG